MKKQTLLLLVTVVQLTIISILGMGIIMQQKQERLVEDINQINRNEITYNAANGSIKHFYELKQNTTVFDKKTWLEKEAKHTINNDSLNERYEYQIEKPENTFRIVALGDSFTYGLFVDTEKNWVELLEDKLNNQSCNKKLHYEVINLGVSGYDIEYEVERYRIRGQKYIPDLILWFITNEDIEQYADITNDFFNKNLKKGEDISEELKKQAFAYTNKMISRQQTLEHSVLSLTKINDYFDNSIIVFNMFPYAKDVEQSLRNALKINNKYILITSKDLGSKYNRYKTSGYSFDPYDLHPNEKGHEEIANSLYSYLTKKIFTCK